MIIDGNSKVGQAKVYASSREMQLEKRVKELELKVKRKYYSGMPKEVKREIEKEKFEHLSLVANLDSKIGELEQKLEIALEALEFCSKASYPEGETAKQAIKEIKGE